MSEIASQVLLGFIQGVTEWLPVSSDGHLAIASVVLNIHQSLQYDIFLHLASLIVVIFYFRKKLARLWLALWKRESVNERRLIGHLIVTSAVTIAVALLLESSVYAVRNDMRTLAISFGITSLVVGLTVIRSGSRNITLRDAVILGLAQGIAVMPGISRSGMMLGIALLLNIKKELAFEYTFLALIPVIVAAFSYTFGSLEWQWDYLIGFSITLIVSLGSLWLLERVVLRGRFHFFAFYTIVVALALFTFA